MQYTLTYSPGVEGWPSFYSFYPEFMIGMNQFFYTFKGANLFRHNSSGGRNTFYGVYTNSSLTSVFNDSPIEKKVFKTISTESESAWNFECNTELESGSIASSMFEKKEGSYFAYIRSLSNVPPVIPSYLVRYTQGIGSSTAIVTGNPAAVSVVYSGSMKINESLNIGDIMYHGNGVLSGVVVGINRTTNTVVINTTSLPDCTIPPVGDFTMFVKNAVAESNGVRGDYMVFTITNSSTSKTELFVVQAEVFKSFP